MSELLASPRPAVSAEEAEAVAARVFGVQGEAAALVGERDANFRLETADASFCLKIANRLDTLDVVAMQVLALEHIGRVDGGLPVPRPMRTLAGEAAAPVERRGAQHAVCLVSFLEGVEPAYSDATAATRAAIGEMLSRLDRALRGFFHPQAGRRLLWDVAHLTDLRPHVEHVAADRRPLVGTWLDWFEHEIAAALPRLRAQPIHNDLHQANLLVDPAVPERITGIVDFGDMVHAPLVQDLAVSAAYQCFRQPDAVAALGDVVAAYHRVLPLEPEEVALLPGLVACRLAQSVVISAWRATLDPENADYVLLDHDEAWDALELLSTLDSAEIGRRLGDRCSDGPRGERLAFETSLARRRERLGPALSLSYEQPVRPVRGDGVWLIDVDGRRHLDAYNNVPHVGHSRPEVVEALARQAARLTTNTRYLVDEVTEYADRLAALLPDPLEVVMFVNSGSEANDLAYQIARVVTGNRGVVLTEHAYHGCTVMTTAISPEEFGPERLEPWAATVPGPGTAPSPAAAIDRALGTLAQEGHAPAMLIADSIFSSDGIFVPAGYLAEAYPLVRAAGGLCVADEVQAGFGRLGTPWWGFAVDDVVPDIVTLGKPMGNGHPMGAVVTTRAIAEEFAAGWHFFSTFAGSPVATACGAAVLDVLEHEGLPGRAEAVGTLLRDRLEAVTVDARLPARIRGAGLFVGVELVDEDGGPAPATARAVVEGLRRRQVLIGRTGPAGNVLKIRPPLVFDESHVETLVGAVAAVLSSSTPR
jgi:4-aminobutyrate aminotransferase-like enzyme/Ser/Thr protein kinase RdoA (MazF antagonist)